MLVDIKTTSELLRDHDNFLILAHQKPDGDTFGAAFALCWALESLGKKARVQCADGFSGRYSFLYGEYEPDLSFEPGFIITADIADLSLVSPDASEYEDKVDLCIDHHKSNTLYAKHTLLDVEAPAASQTICEVLWELGISFTPKIAGAVFTGLSTDTGCFKYSNVTAKTHRIAAQMIDLGADHTNINKLMFDTKSRGALIVDRLMIESVRFFFDGRCSLAVLPADVMSRCGVTEEELDGVSAFPIRIQGVYVGIMIRVKPDNLYRISIRTVSPVDATAVCEPFGGGGHVNAAGCTLSGDLDDVIARILDAVQKELKLKL